MMKLLSFVLGVVAVSSAPSSLRGPSSNFEIAPKDDATKVPEVPRITMIYSSMDKSFSDLMAKQVIPLLESPCGKSIHWDFLPYGNTFRSPHPWVNSQYIYQAPHGVIDFIQNTQQLCTLDTYNNTAAGFEKAACLQSQASQLEKDSRGEEWFQAGNNMKNCFGTPDISAFKQILDCTALRNDNARVQNVLDNAYFKTNVLTDGRAKIPAVMINYLPVDFDKAFTDLRKSICDIDMQNACCMRDESQIPIDKKYWKAAQIYSNWAQEAVRKAADEALTDFDIRDIPAKVLAQLPQEIQDGLLEQAQESKYITDADLAKARGLDVSATQ